MQMLDGFNGGWINFEGGETGPLKGKSELRIVLKAWWSAQLLRQRPLPLSD